MSLFQFLACDKGLEEIKNNHIEIISINEALNRKIELGDLILNNSSLDRDEKMILICDSEELLDELEINHNMNYSSVYAEQFSKKRYFSEIQWRYTEPRVKQLYDYIVDQVRTVEEIEIWSIWLDAPETAVVKSINVDDLTVENLKFLDISNGFEKPECVVVRSI